MPVDHSLYHREAHTWWQEDGFLHVLRTSVNPVRVEYLKRIFAQLGRKTDGLRALDVGCGGGYLTEPLTDLGFCVTGIDPALESIVAARAHAKQTGLGITYLLGRAESLPFPDRSFDLVTCCDVLEHVDDLDRSLAEIIRVLRPSGIFVFDTINRTFMTWLAVIMVAQDFPLTRYFPPATHDWHMFIRPEELAAGLVRHGMDLREVKGMSSAVHPLHQFWLILRMKWGSLSLRDYGRRTRLRLSSDTTMNYIGYGIREENRANNGGHQN